MGDAAVSSLGIYVDKRWCSFLQPPMVVVGNDNNVVCLLFNLNKVLVLSAELSPMLPVPSRIFQPLIHIFCSVCISFHPYQEL